MKRELQLIRDILLKMESHVGGYFTSNTNQFEELFPGVDDNVLGYHFYLLKDAGLIEGSDVMRTRDDSEMPWCFPFYLNWAGHEFLAVLKDDTFWKRTGEGIAKSGAWTFETILKAGASVLTTAAIEAMRR